MYDVIIVGGGPAGLSAVLILGRCRRRVLLCDDGRPRNAWSGHVHGFLTREGMAPADLRRLGREQLLPYETVEVREISVSDVDNVDGIFEAILEDGSRCRSRKLLLATGMVDVWPAIEGAAPLYGRSIFHCPYCDGWELRDQPIAILGRGRRGRGLALELTAWSDDLVLCTDGPAELSDADIARLARNGIPVREERIARVEGTDGVLERIVFASGSSFAAVRFSSTSDSTSARRFRKNSAASSPKPAPCGPAPTKLPRSPVSTSRATRRDWCSSRSSRPLKAPRPRLPSTPTCSKRSYISVLT